MCYECSGTMVACLEPAGKWSSREVDVFDGDSWSNWLPDPARASREHDPAREPFASMSRDDILEAMLDARGGREWEFLREFLLDRCSPDELRYDRFVALLRVHGELRRDEIRYLSEVAGKATRLIPPSVDHATGPAWPPNPIATTSGS
jgi:hypothetical protein